MFHVAEKDSSASDMQLQVSAFCPLPAGVSLRPLLFAHGLFQMCPRKPFLWNLKCPRTKEKIDNVPLMRLEPVEFGRLDISLALSPLSKFASWARLDLCR